MKIRAQIGMVLNLDKCIGCHTCSVTCKNVWTSRKGLEYSWFNNVETKPGPGYPVEWANQTRYKGGWKRLRDTRLRLVQGSRSRILAGIFANPDMPTIDAYYEPFTFNFSLLGSTARFRTPPTARPYSLLTGERMEKINYGPNWEDDLGGPFSSRSIDPNLHNVDKQGMETFESSFMYYLPRLCEHCLNPACAAACPSGAIYKREKDGIVLIDPDKCRGWRECVSACPYKKIYFNWQRKKSEKCVFCFPLIEDGKATICSESCVGRIRYLGVLLYDEEKIAAYAATENPHDLYQAQLELFLDPNDPAIYAEAFREGISFEFLEAAKRSPVFKMTKEWKIAFPLHPEFRTLPMVWYVPPLSPVCQQLNKRASAAYIPDAASMRIPVKYMANMLTAGQEAPIQTALEKLIALRQRMRRITVEGITDAETPAHLGLTATQYDEMYRYLAIANYEDRFVLPTRRPEEANHPFAVHAEAGFPYPDHPEEGERKPNIFGGL